jgi:hypothetical protein
VHDLNPILQQTQMWSSFFSDGIAFGNDEWKEKWTSTPTNKKTIAYMLARKVVT